MLIGALIWTMATSGLAPAVAADKVVRIGYQKYGNLVLMKTKGALEGVLKPLGFSVTWAEFPSGPPLLEALNAGAIDFGQTGEAPPIFAEAAGAPLLYVANEPPAPRGEAILVPKTSSIQTLADLKGKRIALNKGSNVHYLLVKALEKAGIAYGDITPVFLAPADARAAFEQGAVDAWAIWDPYYAAAEVATGARTLATGEAIAPNVQFYFTSKAFAQANPKIVETVLAGIVDTDRWASAQPEAVARQLSAAIHVPEPIIAKALQRQTYGIAPLDRATVEGQQKVADAFFALGLIPKPLTIADVVWRPAF
jgi:sulfonate transport system substrate-binding protein